MIFIVIFWVDICFVLFFFLFYVWMGYDMIYFSFKNVGKNEWDYKYNSFLWSYIKFWNNKGNFIY